MYIANDYWTGNTHLLN